MQVIDWLSAHFYVIKHLVTLRFDINQYKGKKVKGKKVKGAVGKKQGDKKAKLHENKKAPTTFVIEAFG